ncbi:MAG: LLM class F420-dependent oxidoreductase [Gammaproteobacteria bacterium]|nr:MAG: LLM class F420-dependent oxidoreductase [Gammaproteobacteria bacterium]
MKFGISFATAGPFANPDLFEHLVLTAEEVGIESIWAIEHVALPVDFKSKYPYSKDGSFPGGETASLPDPIVSLSYAAAMTKKLRLATGIMILPQRNPIYVAKEWATLDVLSRGRAMMGVGIGWLKEEFEAVGVPFNERAGRAEESVQAIQSLWKEQPEAFEGKYYQWGPINSNPKPVQKPGVPIIMGGNVEAAARRAARVADGFYPASGSMKTLPALLEALHDECNKIDRDPSEIQVTAAGGRLDLSKVARYKDLGVSRMLIPPPAYDKEGLTRALNEFAESIITKVS